MEDYPQPVTGLIKDKSTDGERHRDTKTRYIMMTNQKGATDITNKRVNERRSAEDNLPAPGNYPQGLAGDALVYNQ